LLVATFAGLALAGTIVLRLGVCQTTGEVGLLDALFTATSAVCVAGLTTHDTATAFSRTGQVVILLLIQLGGLGVMTFGALAFELLRRRVSFRSRAAVQDLLFQGESRGKLRTALHRIVLITFGFEVLGALLLYAALAGGPAPRGGLFEAVFLAISAFCNAGFSVYSDSVIGLRNAPGLLWTLMALIVAGGLGYTVLFETLQRGWRRLRGRRGSPVRWSLNSRIAIRASAALIVLGTLGLLLSGLTPREQTFGSRATHALFQSVTARTAGFHSVDVAALSVPALIVLLPLMFIGGSPGSCAGGIKTTSFCVWLARVRARVAGREDVDLADRRVPHDVVRRAAMILALAAIWNLAGIMFLTVTEGVGGAVRLEQVIFEQVSAFATVGLTTGITPGLSVPGKLWIIASMFAGRLGPLTFALAVVGQEATPRFAYPHEGVMVG
jgi:trk system potassium uptake protein TrkH